MKFDISGKIALITGGQQGLGLSFAKQLLKNGLRGVTIADINRDVGKKAAKEIEDEFGKDKCIFVETDVTNHKQFENSFKTTVENFGNIDILVNNAGLFDDRRWEREVAVNINGVIHGILLGLENYIPKHKTGPEGVIVNVASIAGISRGWHIAPVYSTTKFAINGMTRTWGHEDHYDRTKVKVVSLCPGMTRTPLTDGWHDKLLSDAYNKMFRELKEKAEFQTPEKCAEDLVKIIEQGRTGSLWVSMEGKPPFEFIEKKR